MFCLLARNAKVTKCYFYIETWLFTQIFAKFWFQTLRNMLQYNMRKIWSPNIKDIEFYEEKSVFMLFWNSIWCRINDCVLREAINCLCYFGKNSLHERVNACMQNKACLPPLHLCCVHKPKSIPFILLIVVHHFHIYHIWSYSCYIVT